MLVIDEADLIMGYGYEEDMKKIAARLPQVIFTSSTIFCIY